MCRRRRSSLFRYACDVIRPADRAYCHGLRTLLERDLKWVSLEPSAEALWASVRSSANRLLTSEWQQGLIRGLTRDEAFYVRCGRETMTAEDIANGRVIVDIGISIGNPVSTYTMQLVLQAQPTTAAAHSRN